MAGFKTSLLGFSKKDVSKFTKELSDTYSLQLKEKDDEISALKEEITKLNKKIKELEDLH